MSNVAVLFARADSSAVDRLHELFAYDPLTGLLTRRIKVSNGLAGAPAGTPGKHGHLSVSVDRRLLYVHRIVWAMQTGAWPELEIDHKDGCPQNNRWENLRQADRSINMQNRRRADRDSGTGLLGAFRARSKFESKIQVRGVLHRLGQFDTAEQAHAAYLAAKRALHEGCTL